MAGAVVAVGVVGGADQRGQVGAFDIVQAQSAGEGVEDVLGDTADVAAYDAGVALYADGGELGNF
ncbi:hypothetical protein [Streptomyces sp. NPDC096012]|uniref:hypothetical protein n=1 Tax=Streptomyces sp. NPDC096012 TaxID=3155684 RepID=UPI003369C73A